jgi:hypothetical protein
MKFWTRILIMVCVLNTILMVSLPLIRPTAPPMNDTTGGFVAPITEGSDYEYMTEVGAGVPTQELNESIAIGGIQLENPLFGVTAALSLVVSFVTTVAMFVSAPVAFADALRFPGIITMIIMAVYYPALVIGFLGAIAGRDV